MVIMDFTWMYIVFGVMGLAMLYRWLDKNLDE